MNATTKRRPIGFVKGQSGNPAGRPPNLNARALRKSFARHVQPVADELVQRGIERALSGDPQALAAMLGLVAAAMVPAPGAKSDSKSDLT